VVKIVMRPFPNLGLGSKLGSLMLELREIEGGEM